LTTFVAIDDKSECIGYYANGELVFGKEPPADFTRTWKHQPFFTGNNIEYANLFCRKSIDDACPEHLKQRWTAVCKRMGSFLRSFSEAKISLLENCLYDMVPQYFLMEYFETKCQIIDWVFDNFPKPTDYDHQVNLFHLLTEIKSHPVRLDPGKLSKRRSEITVQNFLADLPKWKKVQYNQFGTKTGRLTNTKTSLPILTMDKSHRAVVKPQNDFFVEFDFNAAELRVFLALAGWKQPAGDIHQWNIERVFKEDITRAEAKKRIFAWLYNPSDDRSFGAFYDRQEVLEKHFDGLRITNPFGREIEADAYHALSYLIQSTSSDVVLRQAIKINKLLEDKETFMSFIVHDSVVLDLKKSEKSLIKEVAKLFGDTSLGKFKVNVSVGVDFGELKEIKV
jgi:hypothetical protein